ncbi:MAG: hypothetical protein AAGM22_22520 [Acidobacteriota bacterium]
MNRWPDPVVTASLFADGHLDVLAARAIQPAMRAVSADPNSGPYLWLMRYGLGGDHWKIRFHGTEAEGEDFREALEMHAAKAFEALPAEPGDGRPVVSSVPIDVEDAELAEGERRPRGVLWTRYRRSHVSLSDPVLFQSDDYCASLTRALGFGSWALVDGLDPELEGSWRHGRRFGFLLKMVGDGLAEVGFKGAEREGYLRFHRNTLLRTSVPEAEAAAKIEESARVFDRRLDKMADGGAGLRKVARSRMEPEPAVAGEAAPAGLWRGGLGDEFRRCIRDAATAAAGEIATFSDTPYFEPLFKILHGVSNQIGLKTAEEAYVHHILLRACAPESSP